MARGHNKNPTILARVEEFIYPYDQNIWWFYIPGFNGYEISNTGIIRSMKHYKRYPFGIIIRPKEVKEARELFLNSYPELTYELSDNNNERQIIKRSELLYLAQNNQYQVQGYPRRTCVTDIGSRNQRIFIQRKNDTEDLTKKIYKVNFTIVKDTDEKLQFGQLFNIEKRKDHIKEAIEFVKETEENG